MDSKIVKSDFNALNKFMLALNSGMVVDVGIFGNNTTRADLGKQVPFGSKGTVRLNGKNYRGSSGLTNADVGFIHEFGTSKIPKRSFLRMPIFQKSEEILAYVKKAGAMKKLAAGNMIQVLVDIGIACEACIATAFASSGWGSWAAKKSGRGSPLIDTGQLRRSIASRVTNP